MLPTCTYVRRGVGVIQEAIVPMCVVCVWGGGGGGRGGWLVVSRLLRSQVLIVLTIICDWAWEKGVFGTS